MRLMPWLFLFFFPQTFGSALASESLETPELSIRLVSPCDDIPRHGTFSAGILFDLKPNWHLYWLNPGDAGLAPRVQWHLPSKMTHQETQWAFPQALSLDAIHNFGYSDQLLLPTKLQTNNVDQPTVELTAETHWLVCKDVCIPGKANLKKKFSTRASWDEKNCAKNNAAELFSEWQEKIPQPMELLGGSASVINNQLQLELYLKQPIFRHAKSVEVFIENTQVVSYEPIATQRWKDNWLLWTQDINDAYSKMPDTLKAVIVLNRQQSYSIQLSTQAAFQETSQKMLHKLSQKTTQEKL